jgi:small subunit ribosomal protein S16
VEIPVVRLRFQRYGRHNRPFYRLAALDERTRRDGPVIETLGWYNPLERDAAKQLQLNEERVKYWLSVGAQPSDTVEDILGKRGIGNLKKWEARRTSRREVIDKKRAAAAAGAATEEKKA